MTHRVIHCGTGNVGKHALRAILDNPDLELVGQYVSSAEKIGKDAGELAGRSAIGVMATGNWEELIALQPDCLIYFGDSMGREDEAILDLVPFLKAGINCATYSGFALAHPPTTPPHLKQAIEDACAEGGSTCFFTGIDPGWATTDLAIAALAVADQVECVRVCKLGFFGQYTAELAMRTYFGFGREMGYVPLFVSGGFIEKNWAPTLHEIADAMGVEIEEFRLLWDCDSVGHDVETGFGPVKAGTIAVVYFELQAIRNGKPFAIVEHVDCVSRDIDTKWKRPHRDVDLCYRVEVEGDPAFHLELSWDKNAEKLSAMPLINAVPAVINAEPGLKGPLDIPRYGSRNRVV